MNYEEIIKTISDEVELPYKVVDKTYKAFWLFIRNKISELPLKDNLDEDSFNELRTNFNIPSLGKLTCTYDRVLAMKQRYNYIQKFRTKYAESKED